MKRTITRSMAWLHTWAGLLAGWLSFAIFLSGSLAVFEPEISYWMQPELHGSAPSRHALVEAERVLRRATPNARSWSIALPDDRVPTLRVGWRPADGSDFVGRYLDPATGERVVPRDTAGGGFFVRFHYSLELDRIGVWIVGAVAVAMLVALVSGVVIHRRIFRDFFTFRPRAQSRRSWLDAHNVTSVLLLPFHVAITYTGLALFYSFYMPAAIQALYGGDARAYFSDIAPQIVRPPTGVAAALLPLAELVERAEAYFGAGTVASLTVRSPGDGSAVVYVFRGRGDQLRRVSDAVVLDGASGEVLDVRTRYRPAYLVDRVLGGLHAAHFGGPILRWLYFAAGLGSCAMIASGLALFTIKRRDRHAGETPAALRFYGLAGKVNVAAVAGATAAGIAFFWANRLLPAGMTDRAWWEAAAFFATWLAAVPHALLRPTRRAWAEQLGAAACLCLLLPVLNGVTTGTHLLDALPRGEWPVAGIDLTAFAIGIVLAGAAGKIARAGDAVPAWRGSVPVAGPE